LSEYESESRDVSRCKSDSVITGAGTVTIFADLGIGNGFGVALETAAGSNPGAILSGSFTFASSLDIVVANNNNTVNVPGQVTLIVNPATFIAGSGAVSQQPYPGSQYEDIGIKVKATPNLHANNEVTLQLEFEIKALAGTNVNGIPVITNRTVTQSVRLRENETSLIGGLLDQQETKTITGIPGLAELPGAGYAFGSRSSSTSDSEFLILVTPRKVRLPLHEPHNIYAGRGDCCARLGWRLVHSRASASQAGFQSTSDGHYRTSQSVGDGSL